MLVLVILLFRTLYLKCDDVAKLSIRTSTFQLVLEPAKYIGGVKVKRYICGQTTGDSLSFKAPVLQEFTVTADTHASVIF